MLTSGQAVPVAVTGTGVVSPLGDNRQIFLERLRAGESAIRALAPEAGVEVGAQFESLPDPQVDKKFRSLLDPVAQYTVKAAREAMEMADLSSLQATRIGTIMGIGVVGVETMDESYQNLYLKNRRVRPFAIPKMMPASPATSVSMGLGVKGPSFCTTSACASSAHAIINAALWLQAGLADAIIVGGAEAPFGYGMLQAWRAMRVMSSDTCRPFSVERKGMVLGEGAAALVLERLPDAKARGAEVLAVLRGFSSNAAAAHIVKPDEASVTRAMEEALQNAGLTPQDIGHINAHGTGTPLNDQTESAAIASVFKNP